MGSSQKRRRHLAEAREAREEAAKERANPVSLATLPCRPPLLVGRCFFSAMMRRWMFGGDGRALGWEAGREGRRERDIDDS